MGFGIYSNRNEKISTKDNVEKKCKKINAFIRRLYVFISKDIQKENYEAAMEAISVCAELEYYWNQFYVDDCLEKFLLDIQQHFKDESLSKKKLDSKTVLFYDGFGYDTRGLMLNYVDALLALGYRVVYVTVDTAKGRQPTLAKLKAYHDFVLEYLPVSQKMCKVLCCLQGIFSKYCPSKAFIYTLPYDVAGIVAFMNYQGGVERFQINLTDHAFWLGKNAFDYCIEFRDYGAVISKMYRGIEKAKILKLPFTPFVDDTLKFEGFPFEVEGYKVVFSGGGLYKTFDEENTYYRIVRNILSHDDNVIFLYAGFGDDSELKKLMDKFPGRVWHIEERRDLYQLMEHVYFYLNTYPFLGGLMTQYAALAGKIPVTMCNGDMSSGFLIDRENCKYRFESIEEMMEEIYKLLDDPEYTEAKGKSLKECVPGKGQFRDALGQILTEHSSPYDIRYEEIKTDHFMQDYIFRFSLSEIQRVTIKDEHWELRKYFPILFLRKRIKNFIRLLKKRG